MEDSSRNTYSIFFLYGEMVNSASFISYSVQCILKLASHCFKIFHFIIGTGLIRFNIYLLHFFISGTQLLRIPTRHLKWIFFFFCAFCTDGRKGTKEKYTLKAAALNGIHLDHLPLKDPMDTLVNLCLELRGFSRSEYSLR